MSITQLIPNRFMLTLDNFSGMVCHGGACCCAQWPVYVLPQEVGAIQQAGVNPYPISGGYFFLPKDGSWCAGLNQITMRCKIYNIRPISCRLFPLDIFVMNNEQWWFLYRDCRFITPEGKVLRYRVSQIVHILPILEAVFPSLLLDSLRSLDAIASQIETPFRCNSNWLPLRRVHRRNLAYEDFSIFT